MTAYLWDGNKNIKGNLLIHKDKLRFDFLDFANTSLELQIGVLEVIAMHQVAIYNLCPQALVLHCHDGRKNVFVFETRDDLEEIRSSLK